jgi:hypothetical protein
MSSSLLLHLIVTFIRLARPGGLRSIVAESVLVKHQPLILSRAPNLSAAERIVGGLCVLFMNSAPVLRCAMVLKPSTLTWSKATNTGGGDFVARALTCCRPDQNTLRRSRSPGPPVTW